MGHGEMIIDERGVADAGTCTELLKVTSWFRPNQQIIIPADRTHTCKDTPLLDM